MESEKRTIYLDNAATSFPKPREVLEEMIELYSGLGVSPGRGSYDLSMEAEERVKALRRDLCRFFGGTDPDRVIFSHNATDALNTLIQGLIRPGCHVVSSRLEHNSVLRPLHHFKELGMIRVDLVPFNPEGFIDPEDVERTVSPDTVFVILTHASNVLGTVQPVERIGAVCREHRVPLLLDVTQTAGFLPIRMAEWGVSAVAFTGHKSLLGLTGTGGLILDPALDVRTTRFGGTGRESRSLIHTQTYPHRLEAGTINVAGLYGLAAGLRYIERHDPDRTRATELDLVERLREGLGAIGGVRVYGGFRRDQAVPVLLFNIAGMDPEDTTAILDGDFGIAARAGLHCAPLVHEDLGTSPQGGVRLSLGPFTTREEIEALLTAVKKMASR
jgi:cysteine desulfurase family protein